MYNTILATLGAAALVSAAPTPSKKAFSIPAIRNPNYKPNAAVLYAKALHKYGNPQEAARILASQDNGDGTGTVTATAQGGDSEYTCPVTVGSQTFTLDFDTGSSDLWVMGPDSAQGTSHNVYEPGSTSQQLQDSSWSISYGDGSTAAGDVFLDQVTIGGFTVTQQAVERATTAADQFLQGPSDGLVGLGFDVGNQVQPQQQSTFFTNAINNGLAQPVLGVALKHQTDGAYDFGYADQNQYTGDIQYTSIDGSQGYWTFTPDSYSIGGGDQQQGLTGIADTGTTLLLLPSDVCDAYYSSVGGTYDPNQGLYTYPCSSADQLQDFSIQVGGQSFTIPADYLNFVSLDDTTCGGGLAQSDAIGINIYGDIFLKSVYAVFDHSTPQIGFAQPS